MRIVVALGGNAIQRRDEHGTAAEQRTAIHDACVSLAALAHDHELVVTHGNGPQVGALLAQTEAAAGSVPGMPLDVLVAETQGMIGYLLQQELSAALQRAGIDRPVLTLVTQVLVDPDDRGFAHPTKPVGQWLSREAGMQLQKAGIPVVEVDGKFRRVVPSPWPQSILEIEAIRALVASGAVPIAAGGGGVPVVRDGEAVKGIAAVIDKDRTAALLVKQLDADLLLILTDVDGVVVDDESLRTLPAKDAALAFAAGAFPEGSMGPKIEAALNARHHGARAVIAHLDHAIDAVAGASGTEIV